MIWPKAWMVASVVTTSTKNMVLRAIDPLDEGYSETVTEVNHTCHL